MTSFVLWLLHGYTKVSHALWHYRPLTIAYSSCRFHPTCSEYCKDAILKYGVAHGSIKGLWRVVRCNPLFPGGIDIA